MTAPTIKQMRAWQRQLGSMERKAKEVRAEAVADWQFTHGEMTAAIEAVKAAQAHLTKRIVLAKSDARRQGFASMPPERVAELSRLAVEAKRLKKTV